MGKGAVTERCFISIKDSLGIGGVMGDEKEPIRPSEETSITEEVGSDEDANKEE